MTRALAHQAIEPFERRRRVLVALRARVDPRPAIAFARLLGNALEVPIHALFSWPTRLAPSEVPAMLGVGPEALSGLVIEVEIGDLAGCLTCATMGEPRSLVVLTADPDEALGAARVACEVAGWPLAESPCGVVILRPGVEAPKRIERILLPLEGNPSTAAALGPVGVLARDTGAELDVLVVAEAGAGGPHERGSLPPPRYMDQPHHEWAAYTDEFLQRFASALGHVPPGVPTRLFVATGDPAEQILHFERVLHCDMVVLVWHGELGTHGRVFRRVLEESQVPTLVLRR
jgi:hypothetical protein